MISNLPKKIMNFPYIFHNSLVGRRTHLVFFNRKQCLAHEFSRNRPRSEMICHGQRARATPKHCLIDSSGRRLSLPRLCSYSVPRLSLCRLLCSPSVSEIYLVLVTDHIGRRHPCNIPCYSMSHGLVYHLVSK